MKIPKMSGRERFLQAWEAIKFVTLVGIGLLIIVGGLMNSCAAPSIGDPCGDGHHWVHVGPPDPYGDISCEAD